MSSPDTKALSRRQALRRGAAAGAVVWTAPMIISSTAHATGGSSGAGIDGPVSSVTCTWNQRAWRPNFGTETRPENDYSTLAFIDIDGGEGWKVCGFGDTFTVLAGHVLNFRPFEGQGGGESAPEPEATTPTTTQAPAPTTTVAPPVTTTAPTTTEAPATVSEPVDDEVTASTVAESTDETDTEDTTPTTIPETITTVEATVETIVIDMSGRTDLNVGDVYGIFQVVDAEPV